MKIFFEHLFHPFKIIRENISEFFIWILFTVIAGQFGILANLIVRSYTSDITITQSLLEDSLNGSFYTFSIALVASMLGPIFIEIIKSKTLTFRTLKTFTIIVSVFYLFIAGVIYASVQSNNSVSQLATDLGIDYSQIVVYVIALLFAIYGYCVLRLERRGKDFSHISDGAFNEVDDENVERRIETANEITEEGGIEL
jgi:DMSO reductase anchor subunit